MAITECDRCGSRMPTLPCVSSDVGDNRGGELCVDCRKIWAGYVEIDPEFLKAEMPYPRGEGPDVQQIGVLLRMRLAGYWPDMEGILYDWTQSYL